MHVYMYDILIVYSCKTCFLVLAFGILGDCFQTVFKVNTCSTSNKKKINIVNLLIINVSSPSLEGHVFGNRKSGPIQSFIMCVKIKK